MKRIVTIEQEINECIFNECASSNYVSEIGYSAEEK